MYFSSLARTTFHAKAPPPHLLWMGRSAERDASSLGMTPTIFPNDVKM